MIVKESIIFYILFFLSIPTSAQDFTFSGTINGLAEESTGNKVYLAKIYGHKQSVIDSALLSENGKFSFPVSDNISGEKRMGLHKVILNPLLTENSHSETDLSFEIILNKENVEISTFLANPYDSMAVITGLENKLFYEYLRKRNLLNQKLDLLEQMLRMYPNNKTINEKTDDFYQIIQAQYNNLQKDFIKYAGDMQANYPQVLISRIVQLETYPFLSATLTPGQRLETLKKNFFKPSDFQDKDLLNSNALSNKIITYLSLYRNNQYGEEEQAEEFIIASDQLLSMAKFGDPLVYETTLKYVIDGFEQIKQDMVLSYIFDNFLNETTCGMDEVKLELSQKTALYKQTAIGSIAPEISFHNTNSTDEITASESDRPGIANSPAKLSDINSEYTLVLFWASWCPHCLTILPKINEIYNTYKDDGLEVLAISLDDNKTDWLNTIVRGNYNWLNFSEFKKWESTAAIDYNVKATPMMFLLNKEKRIIAKPGTAQQLSAILSMELQKNKL